MKAVLALLLGAGALWAQDAYTGPRPPKPDVPYLLHADTLVSTEVTEAREEQRKNESIYTIAGATSPARTPLAEPIFLFESAKIAPETVELYRLESKDGARQITLSQKKRNENRPRRLLLRKIEGNLYRIEVNENMGLENGEYSLTPTGSNQAFCFTVF